MAPRCEKVNTLLYSLLCSVEGKLALKVDMFLSPCPRKNENQQYYFQTLVTKNILVLCWTSFVSVVIVFILHFAQHEYESSSDCAGSSASDTGWLLCRDWSTDNWRGLYDF